MKKLLLFGFISLLFTNCTDGDENSIAVDCAEVACTEQFITLIVTVKDNSGVSIPLDRFEVIDQKTLENITANIIFEKFQVAQQSGQYPLYNDSFVSENQNTKRTLIFRGFIDDEKIAEAEYVIDTNCCHVSIALGDTDIIIN